MGPASQCRAGDIHGDSPIQEVLYCSTTGWAFGAVFDEDEAQPFIDWLQETLGKDARDFVDSDLERQVSIFRAGRQ